MNKNIKDYEDEVRSWGFNHVFSWTDEPHTHYQPHLHSRLQTHFIISGEFTIMYPNDESPKRETFGPGARIDVPARRLHEVWMGPEGCTYVIGE